MMEPISRYEIRDELKRILNSRHFAKARKRSRFLEFVCEQTLLGNASKLNEHLIAVEIYERGSDFNPQTDAIVRVQACEIRRTLKDYYAEEGSVDPCRIDLPAGHYVPVFTRAPDAAPPQPVQERFQPAPIRRAAFLSRNALALSLALGCCLFTGLWLNERYRNSHARTPMAALPPGTEWFWQPFLAPSEPPLIIVPNHPILRLGHGGDSPATLKRGHRIPKAEIEEFRDTVHFEDLKEFNLVPNRTDFTGLGEAVQLIRLFELFTAAGQKVRVKPARLVDFEALKSGNAIVLGGNQTWSGRNFLNTDGFWFHGGVITTKTPRRGEQAVYRPEFEPNTNSLRRDYGLILMLPNETPDYRVLLTYGIYTQGTQAAIEYVTNPDRLRELRKHLLALTPGGKVPPPFFQVLITTTVENSVPGRVSFVSARLISP